MCAGAKIWILACALTLSACGPWWYTSPIKVNKCLADQAERTKRERKDK